MRRAHLPFSLPRSLTAQIKYASPNIHELYTIAAAFGESATNNINSAAQSICLQSSSSSADALRNIATVAASVQRHIDTVLVTMGSLGVLIASRSTDTPRSAVVRFYAAPAVPDVVNVSGAGDSFASGFVAAQIIGRPEAVCVSVGFASAAAALRSRGAVADRYGAAVDVGDECWSKNAHFETIPV